MRGAWQADGLPVTEPRLRVLQTIARYAATFSAEQRDDGLSCDGGERLRRAIVYRTLEHLHSAGWLARIHNRGPPAADHGHCATCRMAR